MTLELSYEEARTLRFIMEFVGGDRMHSRRKHTDQIAQRLQDLGIGVSFELEKEFNRNKSGYLYFLNNEESKHDWVEVISHQQAEDEKHFICAHCPEFKIEKAAQLEDYLSKYRNK